MTLMAIFRRVDRLSAGMTVKLSDDYEWTVEGFPRPNGDRWCVNFYRSFMGHSITRGYRMFPDDLVELTDIV